MLHRALIGFAAAALLSVGAVSLVHASPFDGWSVRRITSHPDFVRSAYSLSSAKNHGGPDAKRVYDWIGYIPVDDTRIYFTSFGEPLTCVQWEDTGEWVPLWALDALEALEEEGYIRIDGVETPAADTTPITVEGRG